ncbi:MAG: hypothetical protein NTV49_06430 [Kiritimatiellaeota bacterium]|nr:hypothetical protein [Kiritimatiellota bacterium]
MTSPEQDAANQANALRSTGPKTQAGKDRVSQNAVQHGLQGRFQLIAGEDLSAYQAFHDHLQGQLDPREALEDMFAGRVIAAAWRLRRILRMETEMIDKVLEKALREKKNHTYHPKKDRVDVIFGTELASPEHDLNSISLGEAVTRQMQNADVINKLHRYEAHIERGLYRALHELQRLQATRQGQAVPAPIVLDITTDQDSGKQSAEDLPVKLPNKANSDRGPSSTGSDGDHGTVAVESGWRAGGPDRRDRNGTATGPVALQRNEPGALK